jgi:hypothetical protein
MPDRVRVAIISEKVADKKCEFSKTNAQPCRYAAGCTALRYTPAYQRNFLTALGLPVMALHAA